MPSPSLAHLKAYKKQIEEIAGRCGIANIRVFGSVARGEANENSDVDLLVDFIHPTFDGYLLFKEAVGELLQRKVDVVDAAAIHNALRQKYIFEDATPL